MPRVASKVCVNANMRTFFAPEFNGIVNQIAQQQLQLRRVDTHRGQFIPRHLAPTVFEGHAQGFQGGVEHDITGNGFEYQGLLPQPGIGEEIPNQLLHAPSPIDGKGDKLFGVSFQLTCTPVLQEI